MPQLWGKHVLARTPPLALAISLSALPVFAWADPVPASVRSCVAETDPGRRLACYDRELARFPDQAPRVATPQAATKQEPVANSPTVTAQPAPTTSSAAPAAGNDRREAGDEKKTAGQSGAASEPRHFSARVVSIEHAPGEMILHLDNGQVWQQVQAVPGDLTLRAGDTVKIDKQLGSYWLSGPHVAAMKVRQKG